jgi:DNA-binding response OmpR family regulator
MLPLTPRPRLRVLVVDDDPGVRSVCGTLLDVLGCDVLQVPGGRPALDLLVRDDEPCDVVLLDLEMPGVGGDEVLRVLRRARPDVRVTMISGRPNADLARFLNMGAHAILEKPFRLRELDQALEAALEAPRPLSLCADERGALRVLGLPAHP